MRAPLQGAIYRVDMADAEPAPALFRRIATTGFAPDDFETKQEFVTSTDGGPGVHGPEWAVGW